MSRWSLFICLISLLGACGPVPEVKQPQQSGLYDETRFGEDAGVDVSTTEVSADDDDDSDDEKDDDEEKEEFELSDLERAEKSKCKYFDEDRADQPFSEPLPPFNELKARCEEERAIGGGDAYSACMTNIGPMPPAKFPMPVHETFEMSGEYKGDDYKFIAMVDILITYKPGETIYQDNYEGLYNPVIPGDRESLDHERRVYEITIWDADERGCEVEWEQVE